MLESKYVVLIKTILKSYTISKRCCSIDAVLKKIQHIIHSLNPVYLYRIVCTLFISSVLVSHCMYRALFNSSTRAVYDVNKISVIETCPTFLPREVDVVVLSTFYDREVGSELLLLNWCVSGHIFWKPIYDRHVIVLVRWATLTCWINHGKLRGHKIVWIYIHKSREQRLEKRTF